MSFSKRRAFLVVPGVLLFACSHAAAIVLYGEETGGATDNLVAPENGAPWEYVVGIDGKAASGVYLGYGYVITAQHVTGPLASVSINGTVYATDPSYVPFQIEGADIKLLRILGDPGLAPIPLIGANDRDTGKDATIIGYGVGKGTEVPKQGWNWADESTQALRWGLNTTGIAYQQFNSLPYLVTEFNRPGALLGSSFGEDEASLSLGDSGGGLFIKYGNTWKLAGIISAVTTPGQSLYDTNPNDLLDTPGLGLYTPVKVYRDAIIAAIPEPSSAGLVLAGFGALIGMRRRANGRGSGRTGVGR